MPCEVEMKFAGRNHVFPMKSTYPADRYTDCARGLFSWKTGVRREIGQPFSGSFGLSKKDLNRAIRLHSLGINIVVGRGEHRPVGELLLQEISFQIGAVLLALGKEHEGPGGDETALRLMILATIDDIEMT